MVQIINSIETVALFFGKTGQKQPAGINLLLVSSPINGYKAQHYCRQARDALKD